jgi:hypothetical protein
MAAQDWQVLSLLVELNKVSIFFRVLDPLSLAQITAILLLIIMTASLLIITLTDKHFYFSPD